MAQLSNPLCSQMKSNWLESQDACIIWDEVSKETFERLVQFAYTGDYSIPKAEKRNRVTKKQEIVTNDTPLSTLNGIHSQGEPAMSAPAIEGSSWSDWGGVQPAKKKKKGKKQRNRNQSQSQNKNQN